jgi:hypothetical protein
MLMGFIGVSQARRAALAGANQPIPNNVQIRGLIDTGASNTCVDPSVLTTLGLTPTGSVTVNTPTTGTQPATADQYDVSLLIPSASQTQPPLVVGNLPVMCAELLVAQGFHALIEETSCRAVFLPTMEQLTCLLWLTSFSLPPRTRRFSCDSTSLFHGHGFQPTLASQSCRLCRRSWPYTRRRRIGPCGLASV